MLSETPPYFRLTNSSSEEALQDPLYSEEQRVKLTELLAITGPP